MNFLAHLSLSEHNEDIMLGNFIADSVRRSSYPKYKPGVIIGLELHQKIDHYTDHHPTVEVTKERLRPLQGKYSPVVADILYDHFLAVKYEDYYKVPLEEFAQKAYDMFRRRWEELPRSVRRMIPYMESGNWLLNYGNREGLSAVFQGMSRRANFENQMDQVVDQLFDDYESYEQDFEIFYPQLQEFCKQELIQLKKEYGVQ